MDAALEWLAPRAARRSSARCSTRTARSRIEEGVVPTYAENDAMDFFVQGVVGNLAQ